MVGAAVIGLTTAICLSEAGHRVRIRTATPPGRTTSAVAGAMWGRGPGVAEPADRIADWSQATLRELTRLAGDPTSGVRFARGRELTRTAPAPSPLPGVRDPVRCTDLPDGFADGYRITVPLIDMPRHLAYLAARFVAAGGTIERGTVSVLTGAPVVVNCTGVAARELVPDPTVRAVRGQHVIVANPGLTEFFVEETDADTWISFFPHGDRVVLGGLAGEDDWNRTPDPATAQAIIARCAQIEPALASAPVLEHLVGLRPGRPVVRVAEETVDGTRVLHNYGHGGMGVTLSWGCALAITELANQAFR